MKYAEFNIEGNTVTVYNSILGVESILLNGRKRSKGFSFFGRDHYLKMGRDNYRIRFEPSFGHYMGVAIVITKNGERITPINTLSKRDKKRLAYRLIFSISIGLIVGIGAGGGFSWLIDYLNWF